MYTYMEKEVGLHKRSVCIIVYKYNTRPTKVMCENLTCVALPMCHNSKVTKVYDSFQDDDLLC